MIHKLIAVHAGAYKWKPPVTLMQGQMSRELAKLSGVEARLKLKFLVNHLDLEQQRKVNA